MWDIPEFSQSEMPREADNKETLQPVKGDQEINPRFTVTRWLGNFFKEQKPKQFGNV